MHRGRSASDRSPAARLVEPAMHRLLELGGVDAVSRWTDVGGVRLHHLECGAGPVVLLLHGASGGGANWYRLLAPLSRSFRVLAPDLPGFGLSDAIQPAFPLSAAVTRLLREWLHALGVGPLAVIGTSFGGLIAMRLAAALRSDVGRLVLIDSAGLGRDVGAFMKLASLPLVGRVALRPSRDSTAWMLEHLMTWSGRRLPDVHRETLVDYLWSSAAASDTAMMVRALRLFASVRGQREVVEDVGGISASALIVSGEHDRFFPPEQARHAAGRFPRAQHHLVRAAGHSPNWEAPAELLDLVLPFLLASPPPSA
jgi:pimeloyl-ACP methyl ester carboxylesterase